MGTNGVETSGAEAAAAAQHSDGELLLAWQGGDRAAGERLFQRHFRSIYRFFEHKAGGNAQDLVQRTFLGCVEARDRFERAASFRTFLFAIARNVLYAHWRSRSREEQVDFGVSSIVALGASPSTYARLRDDTRVLINALQTLPLEQQVAVELHYLHGLSGPELAAVVEAPEGTVRSRLRRALQQLREQLETGAAEQPRDAHGDWEASFRERLQSAQL